jgi:ABC-type multidrug transport system fused ATPase/permease subunit
MRLLFRTALKNRRNRLLLTFVIATMCLLTITSQLEIFTMGVIFKKGPDFFELFAPVKKGALEPSDQISLEDVSRRWPEIDRQNKGVISKEDAQKFMEERKDKDVIEEAVSRLSAIFPVHSNLKYLALMILCVALLKAVMLFMHRFNLRVIAIRVSRDLRQEYFEHIQSLPMDFYQKYHIGSLSSRVVGDAALIAEAVNACLINYLQTPFTVVTTLILCFLTSWRLSLIVFLGLPCILFPIFFLAKRVKRISRQIQQNQEKFSSVLIDFLSGVQTVKIFAMEDFSLKKYREQNQRLAQLEKKSARYDLSTRPVVHTIGMFFLATALMYGLYVLHMNVSEILFYCGLLYIFYEPIKKFAEENTHIQRGISAAERMFEVMRLKPHIEDSANAVDLEKFDRSIEFDNVWFRYEDNWVLKGMSFTVSRGQTVAIVGPTGAGKSTIVQLLPRLYDIQEGEIRIDGKSIKAFTQKSLRENMAFVPQKPFLFLDTVAANIAFGRGYTQEQIYDAAKKAHAEEFICKLPQGFDTEVAETGKNFSGGQQQRLAIARALVKKAPLLVMDEATSSLDPVSEHHIKAALQQLRGEVTQIIIAHRLSTIEDADKIIYMEKGEKIAEGTKDELLANCDGFRTMWKMLHK